MMMMAKKFVFFFFFFSQCRTVAVMWLLLIACPPQVLLGKVRSRSRAVTTAAGDSGDESAGSESPRCLRPALLWLSVLLFGGGLITPHAAFHSAETWMSPCVRAPISRCWTLFRVMYYSGHRCNFRAFAPACGST